MLDMMKNTYGLDTTWIAGYDDPKVIVEDSLLDLRTGIILSEVTEFKPNSRMVIFDACYNGDFREKDYIAGRYIMSEGKCVTTLPTQSMYCKINGKRDARPVRYGSTSGAMG